MYQAIVLFTLGLFIGGTIVWIFNLLLKQTYKNELEKIDQKFKMDQIEKRGEDGLINKSVDEVKTQLEKINMTTIELKTTLAASNSATNMLGTETKKIASVLSNPVHRGKWGEKMVVDILNALGLKENISFKTQVQIGSSRSDYAFYLPDGQSLHMDVKFPMENYNQYLNAVESSDETLQISTKKQFLNDIRKHIKDIEKRDYISPENNTLDYAMMFIPNESVYEFANNEDYELIDYALQRKVVLCSPVTLYAHLALIHQASANFRIQEKAAEIRKHVIDFSNQFINFTDKIEDLGKSFVTTNKKYDELAGTRLRQLEKPMDKIKELQLVDDWKEEKLLV